MSSDLTSGDKSQYGFLASSSAWFFESMVLSNGGQLVVDGKPTFAEFGAAPAVVGGYGASRRHGEVRQR